ncbi:DUF5682 family protein, partial [Methylomagnum sp.]
MKIRIFGIRHHSPACARRVGDIIRRERPKAVLIEGPSDFNPRLDELALPHRLPIALYSYAHTDTGPAQCWYPFLEYSPEWVALRAGRETGADVRFIDLPHWRYRALEETRRRADATRPNPRDRYTQVVGTLCERFHCDGADALWDHLFEAAPDAELDARLDLYFAELRGDDSDGGDSPDDTAREDFMARHIAACAQQYRDDPDALILVICGGWHRPALERLWPGYFAAGTADFPDLPAPPDAGPAGCYLGPYEFRQVEALAGYGAGMQSPLFYQWCWNAGRAAAVEKAIAAVVQRLRAQKVPFATADFVGLRRTIEGLANLRGHAPPTRADVLDGFLATAVKESLDQRPPWSERGVLTAADHPVLREALLALTGDGRGQLDGATPQPPLVKDVARILAELDLRPTPHPRLVRLDRREPADRTRAETLWRLRLLGVGGVALKDTQASRATRHLPEALRYEEHWQLVQNERWYPDLIEASVHGATLAQAAENALLAELNAYGGAAAGLATALIRAVRAGFRDLGERLAGELAACLPRCHDHGELAQAGLPLLELARTGFWGEALRGLLGPSLAGIGERLLWLLDGHQAGNRAALEQDADAVRFLVGLLDLAPPEFDGPFAVAALVRLARRRDGPPALRGAALGAAHGLGSIAADEVLVLVRAVPPRDELGDFLYGLFATARELATRDRGIVAAIHGAVAALAVEDFLVALPRLRGAFGWFPPRERGAIAARVAEVLGLSRGEQMGLLRLPSGPGGLVDAKRVEA